MAVRCRHCSGALQRDLRNFRSSRVEHLLPGHKQGRVLNVQPWKAHNLVKKNVFKGGWLHSTATMHVSMAGHSKDVPLAQIFILLTHVQGGVLYVRPKKARNLVKKNVFKGGWLHSTATVHVSIAGQEKKSAQVDGSDPTFSDVIEFILGQSGSSPNQPCKFLASCERWSYHAAGLCVNVQVPGFLRALILPRCRCCQCTQTAQFAYEQRPMFAECIGMTYKTPEAVFGYGSIYLTITRNALIVALVSLN